MADIGKRVRQLREQERLTPTEFAGRINEKPQRVKDIERGKMRPPADFVAKVVHTFHADPNWLLSGEEPATYNKEVSGQLTQDERDLLDMYRQLGGDQKAAVKAATHAFASARAKKKPTA